ncbi:DJ-1/PfpI family protein [uncultured Sneathiella sp.]|uniref:DJ-1/PfpI family protein n=1 Tax=uncultured Sneathiella sp. TaxID=879315 RepID=UPI002591D235|nr:DJ-1/PfpI family protein [uncultured Sneathiella sp.]
MKQPIKIGILLFDDVEELDAVGPYQVFGTARSFLPEQFDVRFVAHRDAPVTCVNGMRLLPHSDFSSCGELNVLVIPGGRGTRIQSKDEELLEWIESTAEKCDWVASVCSGARITLAAGLAVGRRITTHKDVIEELRQLGTADVLDDVRFVKDGKFLHSAGISAGIDMSLWLLGELAGDPAVARKVQSHMEYFPAPPYAYEV